MTTASANSSQCLQSPTQAQAPADGGQLSIERNQELPRKCKIRGLNRAFPGLERREYELGQNGEKSPPSANHTPKVKVKSSPLMEKLQASLAFDPAALLPAASPMSPGLKAMVLPFHSLPATPSSPGVRSRASEPKGCPSAPASLLEAAVCPVTIREKGQDPGFYRAQIAVVPLRQAGVQRTSDPGDAALTP
ncbi:hypothetical protein CB1_000529004 [Camelus ferus]|nr:hypothetical protein CB1_000529004 [Camelus ferus]